MSKDDVETGEALETPEQPFEWSSDEDQQEYYSEGAGGRPVPLDWFGTPNHPSLPRVNISATDSGTWDMSTEYDTGLGDDERSMRHLSAQFDADPEHGLQISGLEYPHDAMSLADEWGRRRLESFRSGHKKG